MKDSLIAAHLVGGASGRNVSLAMTDQEIGAMVRAASRVVKEIKKQVPGNTGRLCVAHLLGGTSGIDLSRATAMTDQEIESMVSMASRVLKEMAKHVR